MTEQIPQTISAEAFRTRMEALLGGYGWVSAVARYLDVRPSTVSDWTNSRRPVPGSVVAVLELLESQHAAGLPLPERLIKRPVKTA